MLKCNKVVSLILLVFALMIPVSTVHAGDMSYRTVARTLQSAAGIDEPGVTYTAFGVPSINDAGDLVFAGFLQGPRIRTQPGDRDDRGLWIEDAGGLSLIARSNERPAGMGPDVYFDSFREVFINNNKEVVFRALYNSPADNIYIENGYWIDRDTGQSLLARIEGQVPGMADGVVFSDFALFDNHLISGLVHSDAGVVFNASVQGPGIDGNKGAIWVDRAGTLQPLAMVGAQAVGLPQGYEFAGFGTSTINNNGQIVFYGRYEDFGASNLQYNYAYWGDLGGGLELIAAEGMPAPDVEEGLFFGDFLTGNVNIFTAPATPVINDKGHIVFAARLSGSFPPLTNQNNTGVWSTRSGSLRLVLREGQQAPGADLGVVFDEFSEPHLISLTGSDKIVIRAGLFGPDVTPQNNSGLWIDDQNGLRALAIEGQDVLSLDGDETWGGFGNINANESGQVAFKGFLRGSLVNSSNQYGVWVIDPTGKTRMIVREGDWFDVNDDPNVEELKRIADINLVSDLAPDSGGQDGRRRAFNEQGELALHLEFTDLDEGIFVFTVPAASIFGDMNGDGSLTNADISAFVLALTDPSGYGTAYPEADPDQLGDFSGDRALTNADISGFVNALTGGSLTAEQAAHFHSAGLPVPEPGSLALLSLMGLLITRQRRA